MIVLAEIALSLGAAHQPQEKHAQLPLPVMQSVAPLWLGGYLVCKEWGTMKINLT